MSGRFSCRVSGTRDSASATSCLIFNFGCSLIIGYSGFCYMAHNVRAWRCGDIPCYVSPDMLLIKDMKMKIYSIAGLYSSVGYVAEQWYIDQDMFVKPP